ncbi:MAG: phenylacetate-CoA oxygenase subunit PaaC [Acidimicrobiia bacterium]|nr:phenylacetate-CoA oxygenase subunit PaaC [Acidimicrobiia bacterium]
MSDTTAAGAGAGVLSAPAREVVLGLADDEICLGHWYATWIGLGPFLEEDLAFTSIGQDELGHARALFALAEPDGDRDALAYGRTAGAYRCCALVEQPVSAWEDLFARHLLYDEAEVVRWEALRRSSVPGLGSLAERVLVEESFHTAHARGLFLRLMRGGDTARERVGNALARQLPLALGLFEPSIGAEQAVADGVMAEPFSAQAARWRERLEALFDEGGLSVAWPTAVAEPGGRRGVRSDGWQALFEEMTKVYALDPAARW